MLHNVGFFKKRGFTLVELLVVIAIIGILVGLLLPAVQMAREAARRMQCTNNLKQLALATHNFESTFKRFPPGHLGSPTNAPADYNNHQWIGHLVFLLPYLEQNAMFQPFPANRETNPTALRSSVPVADQVRFNPWWNNLPIRDIANFRQPMFRCPSDNPEGNTATTQVSIHVYTNGPNSISIGGTGFGITSAVQIARTNYLGCSGRGAKTGDAGWDRWAGIFTNRSLTKIGEVTDGTTNVIMFGEVTGSWTNEDAPTGRTWSFGFTTGPMPAAWGIGKNADPAHTYFKYNSIHAGKVINFALADGSVKGVSPTIANGVYQRVAAMYDGEVHDTFE